MNETSASPASRPSRSCSTARRRSRSSAGSPRSGGRRRELAALPGDVRAGVPVEPLGARARARQRGREASGLGSHGSRSTLPSDRLRGAAPRRRHLARRRRQRARARHDLQRAAPLRARRHACAAPPQARPDEPRAPRLGPGRRSRARDRRTTDAGARRWPDLLGEPDAARALRALRARRRDLPGADRRRQRGLAGLAAAHRPRVTRLRALLLRVPERGELPGRRPARRRATTCSAAAARRSSRPTAPISPARCGTRRAFSSPTSTRRSMYAARQRFDPAGHYHRPDVLSLTVTPNR